MEPVYSKRTLTLQANFPLSLPPGAEYVVVAASLDIEALELAVGDNNADFTEWPASYTIYNEQMVNVRVRSRLSQTIEIIFCSGGIGFEDNSPPIYRVDNTSSQFLSGNAAGSGTLVIGTTNTNGIIVYSAYGSCIAGGAADASFIITLGGNVIFAMCERQNNINHVSFVMPAPCRIGAGNSLAWVNLNATGYACQITYRVL